MSRTFARLIIVFVCASCVALEVEAAPGGPINYADPPQGVFIDDWMSIELLGNKAGYLHTEVSRTGDMIDTTYLASLVIGRMAQPVTMNQLQTTREKLDGTPVDFAYQMDASVQKLRLQGVIADGKVAILSDQFGATVRNEYSFPEGALMTWGTLLASERHGYEPGTSYKVDVYLPEMAADTALRMDVKIEAKEQIQIGDQPVDAIRSRQVVKLPGIATGIETLAWTDEHGTILRTESNMMGLKLVMARCTKDEALAEFTPPEFFVPTMVKVDRPIDRERTKSIDYILRPRDARLGLPQLPETGMQHVVSREDDAVHLTVRRIDREPLRKLPAREYGDEWRPYLAPNPIINSDDPAVTELAAKAKGDVAGPYAVADRLRRFVTDYVNDKNLDVGFASASEVCRTRSGDCTEHAVLLAALGRACGIPTRVAVGLIYVPRFGADRDVFGFHMWTQFRIGEQWVDFDAAQEESDCNPTHIAFSTSSLHNMGMGQMVFQLANVIGNLKIDVQSDDAESDKPVTTAPAE